ncbi:hypothetical protein ACFL1H_00470 [Nanoarchaeota archaeon]
MSDVIKLSKKNIIGKASDRPLNDQFPKYKDDTLVFCCYYCEGYETPYGHNGIVFETENPIVYACPVDSWHLIRQGLWIPGHEKFIFPSIEKMLNKYPTSFDFQEDFKEFFKKLKPSDVYPENDDNEAEMYFETDYMIKEIKHVYCNEITFRPPLKVNIIGTFNSREELKEIYEKELTNCFY